MCAIPEHLRGVFTTRRYTNPRIPYLTLHYIDNYCRALQILGRGVEQRVI